MGIFGVGELGRGEDITAAVIGHTSIVPKLHRQNSFFPLDVRATGPGINHLISSLLLATCHLCSGDSSLSYYSSVICVLYCACNVLSLYSPESLL